MPPLRYDYARGVFLDGIGMLVEIAELIPLNFRR